MHIFDGFYNFYLFIELLMVKENVLYMSFNAI